jgi:glycosyltransferase involved in cell wall biosynthesis
MPKPAAKAPNRNWITESLLEVDMAEDVSPLRITLVLPHAGAYGGIRVLAVYAEQLQRRGHIVTVVSWPQNTPTLGARVRGLLRGRGWGVKASRSYFDDFEVDHRVLDSKRPVTDADVPDADVVVATWWETAPAVAALSPAKGAKCYFIQHDERQISIDCVDAVAATYRLPMHKLVVAPWLADMLRREFNQADVDVVLNSVDSQRFSGPERGKQQRPTVGLMFSHAPFKNSQLAVRAIAAARQEVPDLQVKAFGLTIPSPQTPLPDNCHYLYDPDDAAIVRTYSSCDAWLFTSVSEGFGLPILEAMACRTPVIATPAGVAPKLVTPHTGWLLPDFEPSSMTEAIVAAMAMDDGRWRAMSQACRDAVVGYTWEHAATRFEAGLRRAISRDAQGSVAA